MSLRILSLIILLHALCYYSIMHMPSFQMKGQGQREIPSPLSLSFFLSLSLSLSLIFFDCISTSFSGYLLIYVYTKHTMRDSSSKHKGPWYNLLLKRSFEGRGKEKIYKETIKLGNTCIIINTSPHSSLHPTLGHRCVLIYVRVCVKIFALELVE